MTLYARSDVQTVAVSPDLGCGNAHTRPARRDSTPVHVWALDCAPCETQLEDDAQWSKSRYNIPLTAEEQDELENLERRAESIAATERIAAAREVAKTVVEKQQAPDQDDPDDEPVNPDDPAAGDDEDQDGPDDEPGPDRLAGGPDNGAVPAGPRDDYDDLSRRDLNAVARERGIDHKGTRDEVIARLREHGAQEDPPE